MKATTAYMMTDMMKTVLLSGTGTNAAISGIYQAGKTGTPNYADNETVNWQKCLSKYCNTGWIVCRLQFWNTWQRTAPNRFTPVLDNGQVERMLTVKWCSIFANNNNSGHTDWTQLWDRVEVFLSLLKQCKNNYTTATMSQVIPLISIRMKNHRLAFERRKSI